MLPLPEGLRDGAGVILYSSNWGVAHDDSTFIDAYGQYVAGSQRPLRFWLNATGAKADRVERELRALQEHGPGSVVLRDVAVERHRDEAAHERCGGASRLFDEARERSARARRHLLAQIS